MIYYAGDLHGRLNDIGGLLLSAEEKSKKEQVTIVQVGDLGFGFHRDGFNDFLIKRARAKKHSVKLYTCLGNHDNWNKYYEMFSDNDEEVVEIYPGSDFYIVKRGAVIDIDGISHQFFGGAESTDKHLRKENVDWWKGEEATAAEFDLFYENLNKYKPNTVITHDLPTEVRLERIRRNQSYTPNMLNRIVQLSDYKPKFWYGGHHHKMLDRKVNSIKYRCCGLHGDYWSRPGGAKLKSSKVISD